MIVKTIQALNTTNKKAKAAKKLAIGFELYCPHCETIIPSVGGSEFWTISEIHTGRVIDCHECGKAFKLPVV